jgi:ubiquitin carboxyl-terminal hydrolase 40
LICVLQKPKDPEAKHDKKERKIPIQMQYLFGDMQMANTLAVSTTNLTDSFGWTNGEVIYQQDVSELNRQLLDAIEQSLKGTKGDKLVDSLYKGTLVQQIKCKECGLISSKPDTFIDLQVMVENLSSLVESLDQYLSIETLTGDNRYMCELCSKKVDAEKRFYISKVPPVLTFTLNRFKFNPKKMEREKLQTPFAFPMELDMSSYITPEALSIVKGDAIYDLFSVIIHSGSASGGHYTAYIHDMLRQGSWDLAQAAKAEREREMSAADSLMDDLNVPKHSPDEEPLKTIVQILMETEGQKMGVEQLTSVFKDYNGVAWNNSYKATHGGFAQFVKQCSPLLSTGGKVVKLNLDHLPMADAKADEKSASNGHSPHDDNKKDPYPNWFEFDDSFVTAIPSEKIKKQYGSKKSGENAYMLVYLQRATKEANKVPQPPQHVAEFIQLREQTEMEERKKELIESSRISIFLSQLVPNSFEIEKASYLPTLRISPLIELCNKIEEIFAIPIESQQLSLVSVPQSRTLSSNFVP